MLLSIYEIVLICERLLELENQQHTAAKYLLSVKKLLKWVSSEEIHLHVDLAMQIIYYYAVDVSEIASETFFVINAVIFQNSA